MFHVKRQLLALFMPGFLLGFLYVNLEADYITKIVIKIQEIS